MFDWLLDGISSVIEFAGDILTAIAGALVSVYQMINEFCDLLKEFSDYIDSMTVAARNGKIEGLPLNGAIATYRYMVGEVVFHFTYLLVMFGILFTLYKLGLLLYHAYLMWRSEQTSGLTSPGGLASVLRGIFK